MGGQSNESNQRNERDRHSISFIVNAFLETDLGKYARFGFFTLLLVLVDLLRIGYACFMSYMVVSRLLVPISTKQYCDYTLHDKLVFSSNAIIIFTEVINIIIFAVSIDVDSRRSVGDSYRELILGRRGYRSKTLIECLIVDVVQFGHTTLLLIYGQLLFEKWGPNNNSFCFAAFVYLTGLFHALVTIKFMIEYPSIRGVFVRSWRQLQRKIKKGYL